jgi:DNA-binding transcriptional ArsR family regulator
MEDLKVRILKGKWFDVYDLLEAILEVIDDERLEETLNSYLERELAGYRIVDQLFVEITAADEIAAVEEAIEEGGSGASEHLRTALSHLADRSAPDYRNSIKESICAVESMARVVTGNEKATLGEALKTLESNGLHKALRDGFNKLYGYTSDEHGIRHAMLEEPNLTASDAKFFLVACSAFVNYLRASMPTRSAG